MRTSAFPLSRAGPESTTASKSESGHHTHRDLDVPQAKSQ